jgi:hypothetical protein
MVWGFREIFGTIDWGCLVLTGMGFMGSMEMFDAFCSVPKR